MTRLIVVGLVVFAVWVWREVRSDRERDRQAASCKCPACEIARTPRFEQ